MCRETQLQLPKVVDPSIRQRRIDRPNPPKSAPASTRRAASPSLQSSPLRTRGCSFEDAVSPSSKRAHYNQAVSSGPTAPIPSVPIDTTRSRLAQIQEQALMQYFCRRLLNSIKIMRIYNKKVLQLDISKHFKRYAAERGLRSPRCLAQLSSFAVLPGAAADSDRRMSSNIDMTSNEVPKSAFLFKYLLSYILVVFFLN